MVKKMIIVLSALALIMTSVGLAAAFMPVAVATEGDMIQIPMKVKTTFKKTTGPGVWQRAVHGWLPAVQRRPFSLGPVESHQVQHEGPDYSAEVRSARVLGSCGLGCPHTCCSWLQAGKERREIRPQVSWMQPVRRRPHLLSDDQEAGGEIGRIYRTIL